MAKKTKVTGMTVTRKNNKFVVGWGWVFSHNSDYVTRQQMLVHYVWYNSKNQVKGSSYSVSIGKNDRRETVTFDLSEYDGKSKRLDYVEFVVAGQTKKTSGWQQEDKATFSFKAPKKPTLTVTKVETYTRKFSWVAETAVDSHNPAAKVEWQKLLESNPAVSGNKEINTLMDEKGLTSTYSTNLNSYEQIQETSGCESGAGVLRCFRVRSLGAGGASAWVPASVLYSKPYASFTPYAEVVKRNTTSLNVSGYFDNPNSKAKRIDQVVAQYQIATPLANMGAPSSGWNTGRTFNDYTGSTKRYKVDTNGDGETDAEFEENANFEINNESIAADTCLFFRVLNKYGDFETAGDAVIARNGYGALTAPTIDSVTANNTNHTVQVTATNGSAVPDSHLIVVFVPTDNSEPQPIGVISGSGQHTGTFNYPTGYTTIKGVGVYAHVGDTYNGRPYSTLMESETVYESGSVPQAPTTLTLDAAEKVGVMRVTWNWIWDEADQAEVSWSDYQYAWESTDEPDTHIVSKVNSSTLYITGLETGIPYYVRVRYIKGYDDDAVYGPYSEQKSLILQSAPNKPLLSLTKTVMAKSDETKATWVYTSNDGSEQLSADVEEYDGTTETQLARTDAEQFAYITALDSWNTGTTHNIRVRVWSTKGQPSDWSEPVALRIADPLTCVISSTSLVSESIPIGDNDTRSCLSLKALPLTVTVQGAGDAGKTTLMIRRAEPFHIERPTNEDFDGYEGEVVALYEQDGDAQFVINDNALMFDDDAKYEIVATVSDTYGQSSEARLQFEVHWTHQAIMPTGTVNISNGVA